MEWNKGKHTQQNNTTNRLTKVLQKVANNEKAKNARSASFENKLPKAKEDAKEQYYT